VKSVAKKINPAACYDGGKIARNLINEVLEPEGRMRLYVFEQPVDLTWRQP